MQSKKFDLSNWNYAYYATEKQKALISLVGNNSKTGDVEFMYCPTVLDEENHELFQAEFLSLSEAINFMNERYSHWNFMEKASSSGCGSCEAH